MKEEEINDFLVKVMQFQDGCLSEKEIRDLENEMSESPEKRNAFTEAMMLSQSLNDHIQQKKPSAENSKRLVLQPFLRSCATLVFGAVLGVSTMSVANALSKGSLFEPFKTFFDSFENEPEPEEKGIPLKAEVWSGDSTSHVKAEQGISPYEGEFMLKMVKADFPGKPAPGGMVSELYRWVDLTEFSDRLHNDEAEVTVSAVINAVTTAEDDRYFCGIAVYSYPSIPEFLMPNTDAFKLEDKSISSACRRLVPFDNNLKSWEKINLDMTLPSTTRYLLIRLSVTRDKLYKNAPGFIFPGHYIDDLKIVFKPKLFIQE